MSSISRRTLAKGAAWSLPAVVAASAVPAMAASNSTPAYGISASWYTTYHVTDSPYCDDDEGTLDSMTFSSNTDVEDYAHGFAITNRKDSNGDASPTTSVTISNFVMRAAFPHGMVKSIAVKSGSYTVSGPVAQTVNNAYMDVFTFTFTGTKTSTTQPMTPRPTAWPGSELTTTVKFNTSTCYSKYSNTYATQWTGTYTTANGITGQPPAGWLTGTIEATS